MSLKTTKKSVNQTYATIICVGYCKLANLLADLQPIAHTERAEGWAADIYDLGQGVAVVTGYAPFGNIKPKDAALCNTYNELARNALQKGRVDGLQYLRQFFVQEVLNDAKKKN